MAVEPTAELDRPPVEEFEQKVEDEEESDEYDTEEEEEADYGDANQYSEEEEEEEGEEMEPGAANLTAHLLGLGPNEQHGYIVEEDDDDEFDGEASGTADDPIVLESDPNSKSTCAGTKRGAGDLDEEDGQEGEPGEIAAKKTRV